MFADTLGSSTSGDSPLAIVWFEETSVPCLITYAAEEVTDKNDKHSSCNILSIIQALEGVRLAMLVQHDVVLDILDRRVRWQLVCRRKFTSKVLGFGLVDVNAGRLAVARWWRQELLICWGSQLFLTWRNGGSFRRRLDSQGWRFWLTVSHDESSFRWR